MNLPYHAWAGCLFLLVNCMEVDAQSESAPYRAPDDITFRQATIISEGSRLAAEVFSLKGNEEKQLPTIVMCHGWGGIAAGLRPEAVAWFDEYLKR